MKVTAMDDFRKDQKNNRAYLDKLRTSTSALTDGTTPTRLQSLTINISSNSKFTLIYLYFQVYFLFFFVGKQIKLSSKKLHEKAK